MSSWIVAVASLQGWRSLYHTLRSLGTQSTLRPPPRARLRCGVWPLLLQSVSTFCFASILLWYPQSLLRGHNHLAQMLVIYCYIICLLLCQYQDFYLFRHCDYAFEGCFTATEILQQDKRKKSVDFVFPCALKLHLTKLLLKVYTYLLLQLCKIVCQKVQLKNFCMVGSLARCLLSTE